MALIKCTYCGKEINNKRDKCLLCGNVIPEELRFKEETPVKEKVKLDKSSTKENPENDTKNCPFCFEEIKKQARKCKHCHEYLTDVKDNEGDIQENTTQKEEASSNEIKTDKVLTKQGSKAVSNMLKGIFLVFAIGFFYIIYLIENPYVYEPCDCDEAIGNPYKKKLYNACFSQDKDKALKHYKENHPERRYMPGHAGAIVEDYWMDHCE